jgi:hypothetical protein
MSTFQICLCALFSATRHFYTFLKVKKHISNLKSVERFCVKHYFHFFCCEVAVIYGNNFNLDWGPVPHFCPLEALEPVWLTPEVYCTIPVFLIVPTLVARCLSRLQPAVVP